MTDDQKEQEVRPTSSDLAKAIQDFAYHELDVITDSDWFEQLVEEKVKKILQERDNDRWKTNRVYV